LEQISDSAVSCNGERRWDPYLFSHWQGLGYRSQSPIKKHYGNIGFPVNEDFGWVRMCFVIVANASAIPQDHLHNNLLYFDILRHYFHVEYNYSFQIRPGLNCRHITMS
jgi:hypothetical protein